MEENITPSINLERSELRYIFYSHDQEDIIQDFINMGFRPLIYRDTPTSITLYFGSKVGLEPGISIKARIYTSQQIQNVWEIKPDTEFNLLEIKTTISREEAFVSGHFIGEESVGLLEKQNIDHSKDVIFRIQRASEDGILKDSTFKQKSRLQKVDLHKTETIQSKLTLAEIVKILTQTSKLDERLSPSLIQLLEQRIRPQFYNSLIPFVMTQYNRIHLLPENEEWKDVIRITIDPGVDYFDLILSEDDDFINNPRAKAEFLTRENFCRLEFKIDTAGVKSQEGLDAKLNQLLRKYGAIAYLSKKWTGVTLVSERHIQKQAFWREPINKQISGFFPVHRSWYTYGKVINYLYNLIKDSTNFSTYDKIMPRILVKHQNFVTGYLGVPIPSLVITVEGPRITYELPSRSFPVALTEDMPEFYILEENELPVRSTIISSKKELDRMIHSSIEIEGDTYFRSYGFLVRSEITTRVYKLTIENMLEVKTKPKSKVYCKMRYIGTENRMYKANKHAIYSDLQRFYEEFAQIMIKPIYEVFDIKEK